MIYTLGSLRGTGRGVLAAHAGLGSGESCQSNSATLSHTMPYTFNTITLTAEQFIDLNLCI